MKTFLIIARREFAQLALTPAMYCVLAALTTLYSYAFYGEISATEQALAQPVAFLMGIMALFLVPVITMRSFAGETAGGTLELLFTSPIRPVAVVLGKFAGCFAFYLLSLLPFAGYAGLLAYYGTVDWGAMAGMALGLVLLGAAQTAAGVFVSSLTGNIIVAAAGGCVLNFLFFMLSLPLEHGAGVFSFPVHYSWWAHFKEVFARGMADTRSLVFFFSFILLFLFLTWLTTLSRGSLGGRKYSRRALTAAGALAVLGINVFLFAGMAVRGGREMLAALSKGVAGWPVWAAAGLGAASLVCWKFAGRRRAETGETFAPGRPWLKEMYPTLLAVAAGVMLFANVNYLATRRFATVPTYRRWDLTANQTNTLAPATRAALDTLEEPLRIDVFLSEHVNYEDVPLLRQVRDLLGEFTSYTPKVKVGFYDAVADPEAAAAKAKELDIAGTSQTQQIVLNYGERRMVLGAESLLQAASAQQQLAGNKTPSFQGELVLAIAARRLSDRRVTNIYFAAKIGEARAYGHEMVYNSTGMLADALAWEAYCLRPWALDGKEPVPGDCDVLVLTGFDRPLVTKQAQVLEDYLNAGGRLLLLLPEPSAETAIGVGRSYRTGLETLLEKIGIRPRGDLIVDTKNNYAGQSQQIRALLDPASPVQTNMAQTVLVLPNAQSLSVHAKDDGGWQVWRIVRSLKSSQRFVPDAEALKNAAARKTATGAATVIAAAARPAAAGAPEARMVVAGGVGWASNLFLQRDANQPFMLAVVRWLAGRHYNTAVAAREYLNFHLSMTPEQWRWLWWLTLVGFPEIWLLAGAVVWWKRKE